MVCDLVENSRGKDGYDSYKIRENTVGFPIFLYELDYFVVHTIISFRLCPPEIFHAASVN